MLHTYAPEDVDNGNNCDDQFNQRNQPTWYWKPDKTKNQRYGYDRHDSHEYRDENSNPKCWIEHIFKLLV